MVLQDRGFETLLVDLEAFNRKVEGNIPKHAVVVSAGYSVLTEADELVQDVFERADQMMYRRKQELKQMGAPTRAEK